MKFIYSFPFKYAKKIYFEETSCILNYKIMGSRLYFRLFDERILH